MPRLSVGLEQIFTNLGIVGAGYKLYFFETETSTPKTSYTNEDLNIANSNPIVLNAAGRPDVGIWGADPSLYRMVLGTPASTISTVLASPVVDVDPVDNYAVNNIAGLTPIPTAFWGTTEGTSTNYTLDPALVDITSYSNTQTFFIDFNVACGASPDIDINGLGTLDLKKYTGSGTKVDLEAGDVQAQRYLCINDGTDIVVLNPEIVQNLKSNNLFSYKTLNGAVFSKKRVTISNNVSDANNDIDFSTGTSFDKTNNVGYASTTALIKRSDAVWVAGTNQGGLDTGSKATNTNYYCYTIYNPTSLVVDAIISAAAPATGPLLPTGYTRYDYVGAFRSDGSSNNRTGQYKGNRFFANAVIEDRARASVATSPANVTLSVPPSFIANMQAFVEDNSGSTVRLLVVPTTYTDTTPTATNFTFRSETIGGAAMSVTSSLAVPTNSSSQITINAASTNTFLQILTTGWTDPNL